MRKILFAFLLTCAACSIQISPGSEMMRRPPARPPDRLADAPVMKPAGHEEKVAFLNDRWCYAPPMSVQIMNPTRLVMSDAEAQAWKRLTRQTQIFMFGDECQLSEGSWLQAVGLWEKEEFTQVLVRYWNEGARKKYEACPDGTLFFEDFENFYKFCTVTAPPVLPDDKAVKESQQKIVQDLLKAEQAGK